MTTGLRIPVASPIAGIRLHGKAVPPNSPQAAKVEWLLSLGALEQRRSADSAALQSFLRLAQDLMQQLPQAVATRLDEVATLAVELGLAVAREVVGSAVDKGHVDPTSTVARCLRDCVHGSDKADLVVRLHPADLDLVMAGLARMPELKDEVAAARFVGDPAVGRGGVSAETASGRLRYEPREVLERMCAEVRREVSA